MLNRLFGSRLIWLALIVAILCVACARTDKSASRGGDYPLLPGEHRGEPLEKLLTPDQFERLY